MTSESNTDGMTLREMHDLDQSEALWSSLTPEEQERRVAVTRRALRAALDKVWPQTLAEDKDTGGTR